MSQPGCPCAPGSLPRVCLQSLGPTSLGNPPLPGGSVPAHAAAWGRAPGRDVSHGTVLRSCNYYWNAWARSARSLPGFHSPVLGDLQIPPRGRRFHLGDHKVLCTKVGKFLRKVSLGQAFWHYAFSQHQLRVSSVCPAMCLPLWVAQKKSFWSSTLNLEEDTAK